MTPRITDNKDGSFTNYKFTSDTSGFFTCWVCDHRFQLLDLRNTISVVEAGISGICQECQDEVFGLD